MNRYNGANGANVVPSQRWLSLILNRLYVSFSKNILFSRFKILKSSQDADWLQNSKWSAFKQAVLKLNMFFGKWWYTNMFTNSYTQVFHTFTIIGLIAEFTLKLRKDIRSRIPENSIFETKVVAWSGLIVANISFSEVSLDLLDHYINAYLFVRLKLFLRSLIVWKIICFKDVVSEPLRSCQIYNFTCRSSNASSIGKTFRHFKVRVSEHQGASPRTGKQLEQAKKLCEPLWEITCLIATT